MRQLVGAAAAGVLALTILGGHAHAQGAPDAKAAPWGPAQVRPGDVAGITLDERQIQVIGAISAYFNQLDNMKGVFAQTGADAKRMRGRFYFKKPGMFRFEYAAPSKQVVLSDGTYLVIEDHDLKNDDKYQLDKTPFRILLKKDVDLLKDARILELQEAQDLIIATLQDKSGETSGKIRLFMLKQASGALELKEWIITDAQGLDTRVELAEFQRSAEELDRKLFKASNVGLTKTPLGGN